MKAFKLLLLALLFTGSYAGAQVSVNVNVGTPPPWGPAGYSEVRYYYLPDIATYYDINRRQYIYLNNGRWVRATTLPVAYRSYNLYNGYKVVMTDYRGATPYIYYKTHKVKYPKGYRGAPQRTIGRPPGHAKKAVVVNSPGNSRKVMVKHKGRGPGHGHGKHKHKH